MAARSFDNAPTSWCSLFRRYQSRVQSGSARCSTISLPLTKNESRLILAPFSLRDSVYEMGLRILPYRCYHVLIRRVKNTTQLQRVIHIRKSFISSLILIEFYETNDVCLGVSNACHQRVSRQRKENEGKHKTTRRKNEKNRPETKTTEMYRTQKRDESGTDNGRR